MQNVLRYIRMFEPHEFLAEKLRNRSVGTHGGPVVVTYSTSNIYHHLYDGIWLVCRKSYLMARGTCVYGQLQVR